MYVRVSIHEAVANKAPALYHTLAVLSCINDYAPWGCQQHSNQEYRRDQILRILYNCVTSNFNFLPGVWEAGSCLI